MDSNGKSIEKVEEQLNYKIEFKAKAVMPQNQSGGGAGSFEVLINEKMRYKISYSIENKTALEDFQKTIVIYFSLPMKLAVKHEEV